MKLINYFKQNITALSLGAYLALNPFNASSQDFPEESESVIELQEIEGETNLYQATNEQINDENVEFRNSEHALVMFSVDEEAAGWDCEPCQVMFNYVSWRASSSERIGLDTGRLMYVVAKLDPSNYDAPDFLERDIEGWPTVVHLVNGTEVLEDRIRGLAIIPFRDLVRSIEASYQYPY